MSHPAPIYLPREGEEGSPLTPALSPRGGEGEEAPRQSSSFSLFGSFPQMDAGEEGSPLTPALSPRGGEGEETDATLLPLGERFNPYAKDSGSAFFVYFMYFVVSILEFSRRRLLKNAGTSIFHFHFHRKRSFISPGLYYAQAH